MSTMRIKIGDSLLIYLFFATFLVAPYLFTFFLIEFLRI